MNPLKTYGLNFLFEAPHNGFRYHIQFSFHFLNSIIFLLLERAICQMQFEFLDEYRQRLYNFCIQ